MMDVWISSKERQDRYRQTPRSEMEDHRRSINDRHSSRSGLYRQRYTEFLNFYEHYSRISSVIKLHQKITPILLQKNLSYVKKTSASSHRPTNRNRFNLSQLYLTGNEMSSSKADGAEPSNCIGLESCEITFKNFLYGPVIKGPDTEAIRVYLTISIVKVLHKDKDETVNRCIRQPIGQLSVDLNDPTMMNEKNLSKICIPASEFKKSFTNYHVKCHFVELTVQFRMKSYSQLDENFHNDDDEMLHFTTLVSVSDKYRKKLLMSGEYELLMHRTIQYANSSELEDELFSAWKFQEEYSSNPLGFLEDLSYGPTICFTVDWMSENNTIVSKNSNNKLRTDAAPDEDNHPPAHCVTYHFYAQLSDAVKHMNIKDENGQQLTAPNSRIFPESSELLVSFTRESYSNYICLWCERHYFTPISLLIHLSLYHIDFNCIPMKFLQESLHIAVLPKPQTESKPNNQQSPAIERTSFHFFKPFRLQRNISNFFDLNEFETRSLRSSKTPKNERINSFGNRYYHSATNKPYRPASPENLTDEESTPDWIVAKGQMMINDFSDLNEGEKSILDMWNRFMHKHHSTVIADIMVRKKIFEFANEFAGEILRLKLTRNFLLHLSSLVDFGLITHEDMVEAFTILKTFQNNNLD